MTTSGLFTLHLSSMKAARQTSLTLLGTTTTNCFRASGTAKLSDWLAPSGSHVTAEVVEQGAPDTWMLTGSFKHTSANRVTPETHRGCYTALYGPTEELQEGQHSGGLAICERRREQHVLSGWSRRVQAV